MHNIGNDIVDLNLAKTQSNWQRKGFLEKQFTQKEQEEIQDAENPFLKVWQFWSMKEAAYKCYTQKVEKRFFTPQKFECSLFSTTEGFVLFEDSKYVTTTSFKPSYIHTIAKETNNEVVIFSKIGSSKNIHIDLKIQLALETGVLSDEIVKVKTTVGAPLFYHKEKLLTKSCSISHHGNYGAFVFTL
ncbi:4'-phosphopantetheinyl transferase superfamily protein [Polaribacter sp. PL03]|uniref:4'-phosphopantetheinyl transferase family protein n=1 Tax=Polaribacter sp. PL03 TaxID=3088353 RepID=UPI0029D0A567|nr:4'-phosphopantetheinyl transferase superfamily protein [Polaribacter sp. PL03]MDX6745578.1 4'-phosphopantetheinyl transferase superfamily protein [Polaribacter sp. PL03]